ncbi:hypothetical protein nbrc107696_08390 [Gordonia spumicola]|uniref:Uncharacterized protein n=1 Tax=Gordonia spumicola TaxID=589161 RepID=A0A7I9V5B8_9ACTN|nr:hypothetical protein [Gordonia spumicola]GEE00393.1 hypothetical protein nbrc107696_08390 [Gordonia spumicola]
MGLGELMTGGGVGPSPSERAMQARFDQIDALREQALELERQAVADRHPPLRTAGSYRQMLTEAEADDLERKALRLRRQAAELEWELGK